MDPPRVLDVVEPHLSYAIWRTGSKKYSLSGIEMDAHNAKRVVIEASRGEVQSRKGHRTRIAETESRSATVELQLREFDSGWLSWSH
jgi:hypothetical protein